MSLDAVNEAADTRSRYVVGIDLGTTNSAVGFVDTADEKWTIQTLSLPQVISSGLVENRETLPSFHYQPAANELPAASLKLPWTRNDPKSAVGFFARDHGTLVPGRMINSAKSWLCHTGVDRTAALLPWHGADDVERLSPVEVSSRYLAHIRDAWNHRFPANPLEQQDVVLTLPASFDEVARELTVAAARKAGLPRVVLIEEPQAAFYAWINKHQADWQQRVHPGQKILVCDIGGGTTDFTLIRVRDRSNENAPTATSPSENDRVIQFHRVAVGDHLILGGDNFDLALAHFVEKKLMGERKLEPRQWSVLVRACRAAKETLLGPNPPEKLTISLPGSGSKLIGGSLQCEITRSDAQSTLMEGFLPKVPLDARPDHRRSGFQEFGLPYAPDAAMSKYLAAFLSTHRHAGDSPDAVVLTTHDPARPDILLFNGGGFESDLVKRRLVEQLEGWFRTPDEPDWTPIVLSNERLDLAVAHGAAYYGMVRRGVGVRIAAGLARTYYIGIDVDPPAAICLVPAGVEPGQEVDLSQRQFELRISEPVEFPLFVSSTRLTDQPGALTPVDREQMTALPPIRTVLKSGRRTESGTLPVTLHARLTEIGTLDLWCGEVEGKRTWKLQFDVRSATQTDAEAHEGAGEQQGVFDETVWDDCRRTIEQTFGPTADRKPEDLMKRLSDAVGSSRDDWPPTLLRRLWESLMEQEPGRRKSPAHEARWLNLLGFSLRPGYGLAVDDWRVAETWKTLQGKLVHPTPQCRAEFWTLWRRIAGGLEAGQQHALATPHLSSIRQMAKQVKNSRKAIVTLGNAGPHEMAEIWRLLGSLELLSVPSKSELGKTIVDLVDDDRVANVRPAMIWAVGRLAARIPSYGPLNAVVPVDTVRSWLNRLMSIDLPESALNLAVMLAARKTGDRFRELPESLRSEVLDWLSQRQAPPHFLALVRDGGTLDESEQGLIFGEALPRGLRLKAQE